MNKVFYTVGQTALEEMLDDLACHITGLPRAVIAESRIELTRERFNGKILFSLPSTI